VAGRLQTKRGATGRRKAAGGAGKRPASKLKLSRGEGGMTVREAGRLGGLIGGRKGGLAVKAERGVEFYQEIGKLGGQRVRDLIAAGRRAESGSRRGKTRRGRNQFAPERGV
jgi:uncharacterized protein